MVNVKVNRERETEKNTQGKKIVERFSFISMYSVKIIYTFCCEPDNKEKKKLKKQNYNEKSEWNKKNY